MSKTAVSISFRTQSNLSRINLFLIVVCFYLSLIFLLLTSIHENLKLLLVKRNASISNLIILKYL